MRKRWLCAALIQSALTGHAQVCDPGWSDAFADYSLGIPAPGYGIRDFVAFDDGGGPALYAAVNGAHDIIVGGNGVIRWDGQQWHQVGAALEWASTLAVFDEGSGPALFVGGEMPGLVLRLTGNKWTQMGNAIGEGDWQPSINHLMAYDDGTGPALYAAGHFDHVGGQVAHGVARWNGQAWAPVGDGPPVVEYSYIGVLASFDNGDGNALYAGSLWVEDTQQGLPDALAKWDGLSWTAVDTGLASDDWGSYTVQSLGVWDDGLGDGPALFVGGIFDTVHGVASRGLVRWDGKMQWTAVTPALEIAGTQAVRVTDQVVFDGGSGPTLYIGGTFDSAGETALNGVAAWDGSSWVPLAGGVLAPKSPSGWRLTTFDDGRGAALIVGGYFQSAGDISADSVARWDGTRWSNMGTNHAADGGVHAFATFDSGSGPETYIAGRFHGIDGKIATGIARLTVDGWQSAGVLVLDNENGDPPIVSDAVVFDDGSGPALYIGGEFDGVDGTPARGLAKWDGHDWTTAGNLQDPPWGYGAYAADLGVFDLGDGPALYVCGAFDAIDGVPAAAIARWDGASWSPLGGGVYWGPQVMEAYDDGAGPALYVGGSLTSAEGLPVKNIAKWDGKAWSDVGGGVELSEAYVRTLKAWDDGNGPDLFVGGRFKMAGGEAGFNAIAKWDGAEWHPLGTGIYSGEVAMLDVFNLDGMGEKLMVGGAFWQDKAKKIGGLALWDGAAWSDSDLGLGYFDGVYAVHAPHGPEGNTLWMSGGFEQVAGTPSDGLARLTICPPPCPADCDLSGSLDLLDFLCFSALFDAADPAADCDDSGGLDLFDFLCFVNAFNDGCP